MGEVALLIENQQLATRKELHGRLGTVIVHALLAIA